MAHTFMVQLLKDAFLTRGDRWSRLRCLCGGQQENKSALKEELHAAVSRIFLGHITRLRDKKPPPPKTWRIPWSRPFAGRRRCSCDGGFCQKRTSAYRQAERQVLTRRTPASPIPRACSGSSCQCACPGSRRPFSGADR